MCRSCLSSEGAILPRRRGHFASCTVHVLQMWTNTFHQDQPGMLHIAMWIPCESPVKLGLEGWVEVLSPLRIWLTVCELEAMAENSWFNMILFIEDGDFPVRKLWVYQRVKMVDTFCEYPKLLFLPSIWRHATWHSRTSRRSGLLGSILGEMRPLRNYTGWWFGTMEFI